MQLTYDDMKRLSGHCSKIIERLLKGPALNSELSEISLKYTGRISDLRKRGYHIECERVDGGVTRYTLQQDAPKAVELPPELPKSPAPPAPPKQLGLLDQRPAQDAAEDARIAARTPKVNAAIVRGRNAIIELAKVEGSPPLVMAHYEWWCNVAKGAIILGMETGLMTWPQLKLASEDAAASFMKDRDAAWASARWGGGRLVPVDRLVGS